MNILRLNRLLFINTCQLIRNQIHTGQCCLQMYEDLCQIFQTKCDKYGGIHFDDQQTKQDLMKCLTKKHFIELLNKNIDSLDKNKIKTMWFRFTNENVHLIEPLVMVKLN